MGELLTNDQLRERIQIYLREIPEKVEMVENVESQIRNLEDQRSDLLLKISKLRRQVKEDLAEIDPDLKS